MPATDLIVRQSLKAELRTPSRSGFVVPPSGGCGPPSPEGGTTNISRSSSSLDIALLIILDRVAGVGIGDDGLGGLDFHSVELVILDVVRGEGHLLGAGKDQNAVAAVALDG